MFASSIWEYSEFHNSELTYILSSRLNFLLACVSILVARDFTEWIISILAPFDEVSVMLKKKLSIVLRTDTSFQITF